MTAIDELRERGVLGDKVERVSRLSPGDYEWHTGIGMQSLVRESLESLATVALNALKRAEKAEADIERERSRGDRWQTVASNAAERSRLTRTDIEAELRRYEKECEG